MSRERQSDADRRPVFDRPQGADLLVGGGVRYRLWAPATESIEVVVLDEAGEGTIRAIPLEPMENGFFSAVDEAGQAGDRYKFRLDGKGLFPDPFSRWQPEDVFDASMVIDPAAYRWQVEKWERVPLAESVIYELHIGTFTAEGTFQSAIGRLDDLVSLGITTIEVMPVAAFPGRRNWGYDGVMLFAPDSSYGHPDDLRALVDAAHQRGLNVLLDVVYNHFGPDGNFLAVYSPHYFNPELKTPWGDAINFSGQGGRHVREIFLANIRHWLEEFRVDGFRLDATHEILDDSTPHILAEIAREVHDRRAIVVAEDDRNLASLARPEEAGGTGLDGLWADDFHHTVRVALTRQRESYFENFTGAPAELQATLRDGWLYTGQVAPGSGTGRGTPTEDLRPEQLVHCISNHDQVGNRAWGERLSQLVSPAAYRAASALLCLTPGTPMLFMGQEWSASTPFLYFTHHHEELGKRVTEGRQREFREFLDAARRSGAAANIPDPQDEETFRQSKLKWEEIEQEPHGQMRALYRELLKLRRNHLPIRNRTRETCRVFLLGNGVVAIHFLNTAHSGILALVDLEGGRACDLDAEEAVRLPPDWGWQLFFSSNETRFGGEKRIGRAPNGRIGFDQPEMLLFKPVSRP